MNPIAENIRNYTERLRRALADYTASIEKAGRDQRYSQEYKLELSTSATETLAAQTQMIAKDASALITRELGKARKAWSEAHRQIDQDTRFDAIPSRARGYIAELRAASAAIDSDSGVVYDELLATAAATADRTSIHALLQVAQDYPALLGNDSASREMRAAAAGRALADAQPTALVLARANIAAIETARDELVKVAYQAEDVYTGRRMTGGYVGGPNSWFGGKESPLRILLEPHTIRDARSPRERQRQEQAAASGPQPPVKVAPQRGQA